MTVTIKTSFSCFDDSVASPRFDPACEPALVGALDRATVSNFAGGLTLWRAVGVVVTVLTTCCVCFSEPTMCSCRRRFSTLRSWEPGMVDLVLKIGDQRGVCL